MEPVTLAFGGRQYKAVVTLTKAQFAELFLLQRAQEEANVKEQQLETAETARGVRLAVTSQIIRMLIPALPVGHEHQISVQERYRFIEHWMSVFIQANGDNVSD